MRSAGAFASTGRPTGLRVAGGSVVVVPGPGSSTRRSVGEAAAGVRGRGGWFAQNLEQGEVTSPKALAAIVNSYKSVASVQHAS